MKILALEKEASGGRFTPELLQDEARHIWALCQQGTVREIYFRADSKEAVLVLEAQDVRAARSALDSFPLVKAGAISFDVIALRPYDGFGRLFL